MINFKKPTGRRIKLIKHKGINNRMLSNDAPVSFAKTLEGMKIKNDYFVNCEIIVPFNPTSLEVAIAPERIIYAVFYNGPYGKNNFLMAITPTKLYKLNISVPLEWSVVGEFSAAFSAEARYNGKNIIIYADYKTLYGYDGETITEKTYDFEFMLLCNHYERLFTTTDPYTLNFSDDLNPYNWNISADEGGYIYLGISYGKIINLLSFNEYLYAFMERGIIRISAYGDQSEFVVKKLDINTGEIYNKTVCHCGDKIVFMSSFGINIFDGFNNSVVFPEIKNYQIGYPALSAVYLNNNYYLSMEMPNYSAKIFVIDLKEGSYYTLENSECTRLCVAKYSKQMVVMYFNNKPGEITKSMYMLKDNRDNNTKKTWKSGELDFGKPEEYKLFKTITVGGHNKIDLKINGKIFATDKTRNIAVNIKAKIFEITLSTWDANVEIPSPIIEIDYLY